jgi:hypothetical protein
MKLSREIYQSLQFSKLCEFQIEFHIELLDDEENEQIVDDCFWTIALHTSAKIFQLLQFELPQCIYKVG